jgi:hypothetical protein
MASSCQFGNGITQHLSEIYPRVWQSHRLQAPSGSNCNAARTGYGPWLQQARFRYEQSSKHSYCLGDTPYALVVQYLVPVLETSMSLIDQVSAVSVHAKGSEQSVMSAGSIRIQSVGTEAKECAVTSVSSPGQ